MGDGKVEKNYLSSCHVCLERAHENSFRWNAILRSINFQGYSLQDKIASYCFHPDYVLREIYFPWLMTVVWYRSSIVFLVGIVERFKTVCEPSFSSCGIFFMVRDIGCEFWQFVNKCVCVGHYFVAVKLVYTKSK